MIFPKRGEIWLVEFSPSIGTEIQKTRPALVVSNDIANSKSSKVTVLPLTGKVKFITIMVVIEPDEENCLDRQSSIRIPDITTFDKIRLKSKIGILKSDYMSEVDKKLKVHLNL
jgi:mRNA interferase MazF